MHICEIHEVKPEFLDIDLSGFDILTFDDGLASQYHNAKHFAQFKKRMIFFISPKIVNPGITQDSSPVHCADAHDRFFNNNDSTPYMTWEQIQELSEEFEIGGHSYSHPFLENLPVLKQIPIALDETSKMLASFKEHGINIRSFCYPYNYKAPGYRVALQKNGISELFGPGRTPIETL